MDSNPVLRPNRENEKMSAQEIPIPARLARRPKWKGVVVPFFVTWFKDGLICNENEEGAQPSFPTTDARRAIVCRKQNRCWICGTPLGSFKTFVFGPAGAIARMSYEPPSHRDCARYAAMVCPYLTNPDHVHVTETGNYQLKQGESLIPDVAPFNPGVTVLWITRDYDFHVRDPSRGVVVFMPSDPVSIELYAQGRRATYKEAVDGIMKSIIANDMHKTGKAKELGWRVHQLLSFAPPPS
jgi:hypothetical protein